MNYFRIYNFTKTATQVAQPISNIALSVLFETQVYFTVEIQLPEGQTHMTPMSS